MTSHILYTRPNNPIYLDSDTLTENRDCPHCSRAINITWYNIKLNKISNKRWVVFYGECPSCNEMIMKIVDDYSIETDPEESWLIHPKEVIQKQLSIYIPDRYSEPYTQALKILHISPDASAALSRRCLQDLLREEANITHGNLSNEIQQVINSNDLSSDLRTSLHYIRKIGNLAAHPEKDIHAGKIVKVEPEEAKWVLDTLYDLFDHYFVRKKTTAERKAGIDAKISKLDNSSNTKVAKFRT